MTICHYENLVVYNWPHELAIPQIGSAACYEGVVTAARFMTRNSSGEFVEAEFDVVAARRGLMHLALSIETENGEVTVQQLGGLEIISSFLANLNLLGRRLSECVGKEVRLFALGGLDVIALGILNPLER